MNRRYNYIHRPELPILKNGFKPYQIIAGFLSQKHDKLNMARLACQLKNLGIE